MSLTPVTHPRSLVLLEAVPMGSHAFEKTMWLTRWLILLARDPVEGSEVNGHDLAHTSGAAPISVISGDEIGLSHARAVWQANSAWIRVPVLMIQ